jgi:hypothetical protein
MAGAAPVQASTGSVPSIARALRRDIPVITPVISNRPPSAELA